MKTLSFLVAISMILFPIITLTGCGFQPVYGVNRDTAIGVETYLSQVKIGNIPDREGQQLRNALIDRFYRNGYPEEPLFELKVTPIRERSSDLDVTPSADATRGQLQAQTNFSLVNLSTNEIVLKRSVKAITSYNILGSQFASRVTEQNARDNAITDLARQIEVHLSLYLKRER